MARRSLQSRQKRRAVNVEQKRSLANELMRKGRSPRAGRREHVVLALRLVYDCILEDDMADAPTLTAMQRHVLENLNEVVKGGSKAKSADIAYEFRGKDVSAQINSLVAKRLISQDRAGVLSRLV